MREAIEHATRHLRDTGYPATIESVAAIAERYPFLARRSGDGWQHLVRLYVEHPEWRQPSPGDHN